MADRIAVLRDGVVSQLGTPAELIRRLDHLSVIEIQTEGMEAPLSAPPAVVRSVDMTARPGALGVNTWRIHVQKGEQALGEVIEWIARPNGRITFVGESSPTFHDVLMLQGSEALT